MAKAGSIVGPLADAAPAHGLTRAQARQRLRRFGPNAVEQARAFGPVADFLRRFRNPLVLILVAASCVAGFSGDLASFAIIVAGHSFWLPG